MPAAGGSRSRGVSRARACPGQMVHRRHPLSVLTPKPPRWSPATPMRRGTRAKSSPTSAPARSTGSRPSAPHPVHLGREAARRYGPDGDRHPGDLALAEPDLLRRRPRSRHRHRARRQRQSRRHRRPPPRPLRPARHGAVSGARTRGGRTRPDAQIARAFAASRSPPTSPARISRPSGSARSSRGSRSWGSWCSCTRPVFPRRGASPTITSSM